MSFEDEATSPGSEHNGERGKGGGGRVAQGEECWRMEKMGRSSLTCEDGRDVGERLPRRHQRVANGFEKNDTK